MSQVDVSQLVIRHKRKKDPKLNIRESITDATVDRTIEGASTLTLVLSDPEWVLLDSGLFDVDQSGRVDHMDVKLDRHWYRLVKVSPSDDQLTLVLEDREVAMMRADTKKKRQRRTVKNTRAEFIHSMVKDANKRGAGIDWWCPSEHERQRATIPRELRNRKQDDKPDKAQRGKGGIAKHAGLTVKGVDATPYQKHVAEIMLTVAQDLRAPRAARIALIVAAIVESLLRNPTGGDDSSVGVLQLLSSHLGGSTSTDGGRRDIALVSEIFLKKGFTGRGGAMALARDGLSPAEIAQAVQGSAYPSAYAQWASEAAEWVDSFDGDAGSMFGDGGGTYYSEKAYYFTRGEAGKKEDSWTAGQRLAGEVGWRLFMDRGTLVFMSEEELYGQKPAYLLDRSDEDVLTMSFDWDQGKKVNEMSVTLHADRWAYGPGVVVDVVGAGPGNGRWIVSNVSRSLFTPFATVTLKQPQKPKREPAPEVRQVNVLEGGSVDLDSLSFDGRHITIQGGARGIVDQAAAMAAQISNQNYVGSDYRPGSTTTSGNPSDHGSNDADQAARDIGHRGIDLLVGPPHRSLDLAVVAIGRAFGRNYGDGRQSIIDTFNWRGFRIQIIWRTPAYGGHMGHIHIGARKL